MLKWIIFFYKVHIHRRLKSMRCLWEEVKWLRNADLLRSCSGFCPCSPLSYIWNYVNGIKSWFLVISTGTPFGTPKRKLPLESGHSYGLSNKKRRSIKNLGLELRPNAFFGGLSTPGSGTDYLNRGEVCSNIRHYLQLVISSLFWDRQYVYTRLFFLNYKSWCCDASKLVLIDSTHTVYINVAFTVIRNGCFSDLNLVA